MYQLTAQILITEVVMEILMKKENVMNNAVQVRIVKLFTINYRSTFFNLQKSHTGVPGGSGRFVVKHVEVVYPSESDSATNLDVHIPFITSALGMIMKR